MLGIFNVLPFLKGWTYKRHRVERMSVKRGAPPIVALRLSETGLVYSMMAVSDDCYGTVMLEYQGADLRIKVESLYPEMLRSLGMVSQDPSGWIPLYHRPNPNSTAGVFVGETTGGYQGSTYPYTPSIVLKLYLPLESTQNSAYISGVAEVVAILDKKLFIHSLRRLLNAKADLWIDPALLMIGKAEFVEAPPK